MKSYILLDAQTLNPNNETDYPFQENSIAQKSALLNTFGQLFFVKAINTLGYLDQKHDLKDTNYQIAA